MGQVNAFIFLSNNDWAQIKDSDEMAYAVNKKTIETFWLFFLNIIWINFWMDTVKNWVLASNIMVIV